MSSSHIGGLASKDPESGLNSKNGLWNMKQNKKMNEKNLKKKLYQKLKLEIDKNIEKKNVF